MTLKDNLLKFRELEIKDVKLDVFMQLFDYLYSGTCDISQDNYIDLILGANTLGIEPLKLTCWEFIFKTQCTGQNVLQLLKDAKDGKFGQIKTDELILKCQGYIADEADSIFTSRDFVNISEHLLGSLLKATKLNIDESAILEGLLKWADKQVKDTKKTRKEVLAPLLQHIRLPLIDAVDLIQKVKPLDLFSMDAYLIALEYQISPEDFANEKDVQFLPRGTGKMMWDNKSRTMTGTPTGYTGYWGTLLKSGRHKWSVKIEEYAGADWQMIHGVCQSTHPKNTYLGDKMGWGWSSHGSQNHGNGNANCVWEKYTAGDVLTFDLDLGKGTMYLYKNKNVQKTHWTGIVGPVHVAMSASASFKCTFI